MKRKLKSKSSDKVVSILFNTIAFLTFLVPVGFIFAFIWSYSTQHIGKMPIVPVDASIDAPKYTMPIVNQGSIYNLLENGSVIYFYFGSDDCLDCEGCKAFNTALNSVMDGLNAYKFDYYHSSVFYHINYSYVFYYDINKMPRNEVNDIITLFSIANIPCLVKVKGNIVVDFESETDELKIKKFFS